MISPSKPKEKIAASRKVSPENLKHKLPTFVTKWIDKSSKYGIAFQLTDNTRGIFYNDRTLMFEPADQEDWFYVQFEK